MIEILRRVRRRARALVYRAGKAGLRRLGYDVELVRRLEGEAAPPEDHPDGEFYREWTTAGRVWMPWCDDRAFRAAYDGVAPYTVVSIDRCCVVYSLACQARSLPGDFAECGVFNGGLSLLLARAIADVGKTLYLFDSFEGLPTPDKTRDSMDEGTFRSTSEDSVRKLLEPESTAVEVRFGWIPKTFYGLDDQQVAMVHVDVDLYRGTLDCCEHFYPRLVPGGVMVFDDYGFSGTRGTRLAVEEFFADKPEVPLVLPTGQAILFRLGHGDDQ